MDKQLLTFLLDTDEDVYEYNHYINSSRWWMIFYDAGLEKFYSTGCYTTHPVWKGGREDGSCSPLKKWPNVHFCGRVQPMISIHRGLAQPPWEGASKCPLHGALGHTLGVSRPTNPLGHELLGIFPKSSLGVFSPRSSLGFFLENYLVEYICQEQGICLAVCHQLLCLRGFITYFLVVFFSHHL